MILHESAEMYLETIYVLHNEQDFVRSVDIASRMGYSKPTISEWMGKLAKGGYVIVEDSGNVALTDEGRAIAEKVYERHVLLENVFKRIGVTPDVATEDACRVEHYISDETFNCIKRYFEQRTA